MNDTESSFCNQCVVNATFHNHGVIVRVAFCCHVVLNVAFCCHRIGKVELSVAMELLMFLSVDMDVADFMVCAFSDSANILIGIALCQQHRSLNI